MSAVGKRNDESEGEYRPYGDPPIMPIPCTDSEYATCVNGKADGDLIKLAIALMLRIVNGRRTCVHWTHTAVLYVHIANE